MASGSGWNLWVWLAGGECGCKEVYRFPHITYPYSSCICPFFCSSILTFCSFLKMFFILDPVHFCNLFNNFSAQYKQTYGRL